MARCIDDIELVCLAALSLIVQRDALRLYSDSSLPLDIHGVEDLSSHFAIAKSTTVLDKSICKRRFPMINMGNDREIADIRWSSQRGTRKVLWKRASLMEIPGQRHSNCLVIHFYRDKERLPISNNAYWNRHPLWQRFYLLLKRLY